MQRRVIDLHEGHTHIQCIKTDDKVNPYRVYLVISVTGEPIRRRLLIKYADFMSVLCFLTEFFRDGLDVLSYCEMKDAIRSRTI